MAITLDAKLTLDVKNFSAGITQANGLLGTFGKNLTALNNSSTNLGKIASAATNLNTALQNTQSSQAAITSLQSGLNALQSTLNNFSTASVQKIQAITQALQGMNQALKGVTSAGTTQATSSLNSLAQTAHTTHAATTKMHGGWRQWETALMTWASTRGWRESFHEMHSMFERTGEKAKEAIHEFVAFEDNALRAAAVFASGGEDFVSTSDKIYQASIGALGNTKFGMEALSESFVELATAGFNSSSAINALPVVTNLAQAGMMKLGQTTEIVTAGQHEWGFTNEKLVTIADAMTKTFSYSANTLSSLQQSYKYAGAAAKASGESFSEFNSLLAVLANVGFKGSNAGTALRSTFINLQTQTGAAGEALKRYNVQVYDSQGKLRPMIDLLEELNEKTHHDVGQISLITGKYASSGITSLMGQLKREGEESNNALRIMQARLQGLNETSAINLIKNLTEIKNGENAAGEGAKELQRLGVSAFNEMKDKAGEPIKNLKSLQQLSLEIFKKGGNTQSLVKLGVNEKDAQNIFNTINKVKQANSELFNKSDAASFGQQLKLIDEEMLLIGNATENIAKRNESGLGGALRLLKNNIEAIGIAVVREVQPALNALLAGSPDAQGIRQLGGLAKILQENKQEIVEFLSGIANVVVTLAEWGVQAAAVAIDHKEIIFALGAAYLGSILLKNQIVELAAAYLGKWVVAMIQSGTATKAVIVQNAALSASQSGLLGGISRGAQALMTWVVPFAGAANSSSLLTAALGGVSLGIKGVIGLASNVAPILVFAASLERVGTLAAMWWNDTTKADEEKRFAEAIQRSNNELEKRKGINLDQLTQNSTSELRNVKASLIQSISALESVQAEINAKSGDELFSKSNASGFAKAKPEDFANLQKYKEQLVAVNQELKKEHRVQDNAEYDKMAEQAHHYQKVLEESTESGTNNLVKFNEVLKASVSANFDQQLAKVNDELKQTIDLMGKDKNEDTLAKNQQKIVAATARASQQIVSIESARMTATIDISERIFQAKAEEINKYKKNDEEASVKLREAAMDLAKAKVDAAKQAYDATKAQLDKSTQDYMNYVGVVKQLEKSIEDERKKQSSTVRELMRTQLTDSKQFESERKELAKATWDTEAAAQQGNYQLAETLAKKREQLAKSLESREKISVGRDAQADRIKELSDLETTYNQAMQDKNYKLAEETARKRETLVREIAEKEKQYNNDVLQRRQEITNQQISLAKEVADKEKDVAEKRNALNKSQVEGKDSAEINRLSEELRIASGELQKLTELKSNFDSVAFRETKNSGLDESDSVILKENFKIVEQTKSAHDAINQAMAAQKAEAEANVAAQKQQVDSLTQALQVVGKNLDVLRQNEVDVYLKVNDTDINKQLAEINQKFSANPIEQNIKAIASVDQANQAIDAVIAKLAKVVDKTVTVTVKTAESHFGGGIVGAVRGYFNGGHILKFAAGGKLPGFSNFDNIAARIIGTNQPVALAGGEMIVNNQRTRMFDGLLNFINFGNEAAVKRFKESLNGVQTLFNGGPVLPQVPVLHFNSGGVIPSATSSIQNIVNQSDGKTMTPVVFNIGGQKIAMHTDNVDAVGQLINALTGHTRGG